MVRVHVTPPEDSSEADEVAWAHRLGRKLQEEFKPFEDGDVVIHAQASAYGYGRAYNDIDIVVVGIFPNGIDRQIDCMVKVPDDEPRQTRPGEMIRFYSFCLTLEIKAHHPGSVRVVGLNRLDVRYENGWKSATDQSEGQKEAMKAILRDYVGTNVWVCNAIWLTSFERAALPSGVHNALSKIITLYDLLRVCCDQNAPYQYSPAAFPSFRAVSNKDRDVLDARNLTKFLKTLKRVEVQSQGNLTRKRLEYITTQLIDDQQYARAIGRQLVIIRGKPGTGKTVKLLRLAHDLARLDGSRIRILTYNLALVSDIRRLIALTGINDDDTAGLIEISSLDKFFYEIIVASELHTFDYDKYFDKKDRMLHDIQEALEMNLISEGDVASWLERREFRFDYIFVDEGQDWPPTEQVLLLKIFGPARVIVGDGIDQMIRGQARSEWSQQAESQLVHRVPPERRCLRQKYNLNEFNRALARATDQSWNLQSREEFTGGRIIIATGGYTQDLHERLWRECQQDGNKGYEMLFMVPPSLADRGRGFSLREQFESWGMHLWDGTMLDTRKEYPTDSLEHRVLQYESCRGLEAWTGICLELDEVFELKVRSWQRQEDQLTLEDDDVLRIRDAHQWCMIPLTRAIDTTVITLKDLNSEFSQTLLKVAREKPDVVQIL